MQIQMGEVRLLFVILLTWLKYCLIFGVSLLEEPLLEVNIMVWR